MRQHLHQTGSSPYLYSDSGYSDLSNHPKLSSGWVIVQGEPPSGAVRFQDKDLTARLNGIFALQIPALRAQFASLKAGVRVSLEDGDEDAAKLIIQGATIDPSLEPIRIALLAEFPA